MTIAAVVHSPGPSSFAQYHDCLLLQQGGRPAYYGPSVDLKCYWSSIGFHMCFDISPDGASVSDYSMKVGGTHTATPRRTESVKFLIISF